MAKAIKLKTYEIDTSTEDGIVTAERKKARLENDGWAYVRTVVLGFDRYRITYRLDV